MELRKKLKKRGSLLLFLIPAMAFALVFCYVPMGGIIMAFKKEIDLSTYDSAFASIVMAPWGGFEQFGKLFSGGSEFLSVFRNTLVISVLKIVIVFPIPILVAILVTELRSKTMSKTFQSIMYLPHFLSWGIAASIFMTFLHTGNGALSNLLRAIGLNPINVSDPNQFPWIMVATTAWKDVGWSTITFIAAIMAIDSDLYEAAKIDGAGKIRQILSVTLPGMATTIVIVFILRVGYLMDAGFDQVYAMLTPTAESRGDIIGTYIYRLAIKNGGSYALTTAAGLFNSVISLTLIIGGNLISKKVFKSSIF